ncbi:MAG: YcaO-like family protein [Kofleriaceae bacterium]
MKRSAPHASQRTPRDALSVSDGTHRTATLEATWARFAPAMKRAQITRIADITGLDTLGVPVFAAIRPMGRSLSTQQGKGITAAHARVSALMESLETWTAENLALPTTSASVAALGERAVDVTALPHPRGVLDDPPRTGRRSTSRRSAKPAAWRSETWRWVAGRELVTDREVLVPEQSVTLDTTFTTPPMFDISSNGLASGNVLVEAIAHGLAEVIERDAEAAWRRAGSDRRLVLDTIPDPICRALIDRITSTGARIWIWDLEGIIPVVGCAIMEDPREPAWRALGFYQGFGAHVDARIAIARAITEAAQTRLTYIAGARDDFFPFDYERATDPHVLADLWERMAAPCDTPALFDDLPTRVTRSIDEDLDVMLEAVTRDGSSQVIVVDLTHPDLDVPVVKVLVPGRATDIEAMG